MLGAFQNGRHVSILCHQGAHALFSPTASFWREAAFVRAAYLAYLTYFGDVHGLYIVYVYIHIYIYIYILHIYTYIHTYLYVCVCVRVTICFSGYV